MVTAPPLSWRRILLVWSVPALLTVVERWYFARLSPRAFSWWPLIVSAVTPYACWALLTPLLERAVRRFRFSQRLTSAALLAHLGLGIFCQIVVACTWAVLSSIVGAAPPNLSVPALLAQSLVGFFPTMTLVYVAAIGVLAWRQADAESRNSERLAAELVKAELMALRRQLNPHFLFNALNSIAILVREADRETAAIVVTRLANVLRALLEGDNTPVVALREEINLTADYLEIELARFADRLTVVWQVDATALEARVPIFLLQPLVENAVRHGVGQSVGPSTIEIGAKPSPSGVRLWVRDWGTERDPKSDLARGQGFGIGLENVRTRLRLLYGTQAAISIADEMGEFTATVDLPSLP